MARDKILTKALLEKANSDENAEAGGGTFVDAIDSRCWLGKELEWSTFWDIDAANEGSTNLGQKSIFILHLCQGMKHTSKLSVELNRRRWSNQRNRPDAYAEDAKSKGFTVEHDFGKVAEIADSE